MDIGSAGPGPSDSKGSELCFYQQLLIAFSLGKEVLPAQALEAEAKLNWAAGSGCSKGLGSNLALID